MIPSQRNLLATPRTVVELRDYLIERGIKSVKDNEKEEHKRRGGIAGFELCRTLNSIEDFQNTLAERHGKETDMVSQQVGEKVYWEYRYATVQVEFVWERLKILFGIGPTISGNAYLDLAEITGVRKSK